MSVRVRLLAFEGPCKPVLLSRGLYSILSSNYINVQRPAINQRCFSSLYLSRAAKPCVTIRKGRVILVRGLSSRTTPKLSTGENAAQYARRTEDVPLQNTRARGIRTALRQWYASHPDDNVVDLRVRHETSMNDLTRPSTDDGQNEILEDEIGDQIDETYELLIDENEEHEFIADDMYFKPGDLVDLGTAWSSPPLVAVFLGDIDDKLLFYTENGKLIYRESHAGLFRVPGYFQPGELEHLWKYESQFTDTSQPEWTWEPDAIPLREGLDIITRLKQFQEDAAMAYRQFSAILDRAHELVARKTTFKFMTLEEIAAKVIGIPEEDLRSRFGATYNPFLLAVCRAIMRHQYGFKASIKRLPFDRVVTIESRETCQAIERAYVATRRYRENKAVAEAGGPTIKDNTAEAGSFERFIRTCRRLIAKSRKIRLYSPDSVVFGTKDIAQTDSALQDDTLENLEFTATDLDFIRFLMVYLHNHSPHLPSHFRVVAPVIMRATGFYNQEKLRKEDVRNFLVEIGVLQPFTLPVLRDYLGDYSIEKRLKEASSKVNEEIYAGKDILSAAKLRDSMLELRRDWGDIPMFCIDESAVKKIEDDAISIEAVPGKADESWIHAHVAHVSALCPPGHVLSQHAEAAISSMFGVNLRHTAFTDAAARELSVQKNGLIITFSSRVNEKGEVLEQKIQPGIARNVVPYSFKAVNELSGISSGPVDDEEIQIRGSGELVRPPKRNVAMDTVREEHRADLERLFRLTRATEEHSRRSLINFAYNLCSRKAKVESKRNSMETIVLDSIPNKPTYDLAHPSMTLPLMSLDRETVDVLQSPAHVLVRECMQLAGICAANFAVERNLSVVFSATKPAPHVDEKEQYLKRLMRLRPQADAGEARYVAHKLLSAFSSNRNSLHPLKHHWLGNHYYTRVTSPLRRFEDLLNGWQIDAALRAEAKQNGEVANLSHESDVTTTHNLSTSDIQYVPPLAQPRSRAEMEAIVTRANDKLSLMKRLTRNQKAHWTVIGIARAHYFGEGELPSPLTAIAAASIKKTVRMVFDRLDCVADIVPVTHGGDGNVVCEGDRWEVEIEHCSIWNQRLQVRPVRFVSSIFGEGKRGTCLSLQNRRFVAKHGSWTKKDAQDSNRNAEEWLARDASAVAAASA